MTDTKVKTPVVALYLRVSTSQQDHQLQLDELREEANKMSATIYNEYADKIGGATQVSERDYADDVIRDASLGKFQILLVWKIDRIARDEEFGLTYLRRIEETGCKIKFLKDAGIDTPEPYTEQVAGMVKTMRLFYLMGARMQLESIKTNVRASKKNWIKANRWPSSIIPDGYLLDTEGGRYGLKINPERAPVIIKIFDLYVDGKMTSRQIVDFLNKEGTPSYKGRPWGKDTIQDKLSNKLYIGKLPIFWKDKINKTSSVLHTFTCPPIISDARFAEVQEIKNEKIKRSRGNHKREYPFRPYVWCATCGYELHTLTSGACTPNESYHYGFRKPPVAFKYKKRCPEGCGRISERNLVRGIYKHVGMFFLQSMRRDYSKSNIDKVLEFLEGGDTTDINKKREMELEQLTKELGKLREKPERIKDMFESGHIDKKEFEARMVKYNSNPRIKNIEERIRFIQQSLIGEEEQKRRIGSLTIWAKEVTASLKSKHIEPWVEDTADITKLNGERKHTGFFYAPYENQKEFVLQVLKFVKKIHVDFHKRRLTIQTKIPKYLDGKVAFEADPVVARGRPGKDSNKNRGNDGGNNSSIQGTSVNSSNPSINSGRDLYCGFIFVIDY